MPLNSIPHPDRTLLGLVMTLYLLKKLLVLGVEFSSMNFSLILLI